MSRKGPHRDAGKERFWREVIRRQQRSGLSVRGFCRDEALSEPSFYAWRRELKLRGGQRLVGGELKLRGGRRLVGREHRSAALRPQRTKCPAASRPAFVAVQLAADAGLMAAGKIELALPSGAVLRLPTGIGPAAVAAIVNAWERERC